MDVIQEAMNNVFNVERVRMGWKGQLPIFSLTQALNVVMEKGSSDQYGRMFIHNTVKIQHPDLHARIVYHKFPLTPHPSPCMSFPNILLTVAKAKQSLSDSLHNLVVDGFVTAEAGDKGLMEYVLGNASLDTEYHDLMQKIVWAEENPELVMQGNEVVGEEDDADASEVRSFLCVSCGRWHRE